MSKNQNKNEDEIDDVTLDLYDSEDEEEDEDQYIDEAEIRSDIIERKQYYANLL
jgi:hypothetical protein